MNTITIEREKEERKEWEKRSLEDRLFELYTELKKIKEDITGDLR